MIIFEADFSFNHRRKGIYVWT